MAKFEFETEHLVQRAIVARWRVAPDASFRIQTSARRRILGFEHDCLLNYQITHLGILTYRFKTGVARHRARASADTAW